MGVFDRQQQTAVRLIRKYGQPATLVQTSTPAQDPATPWIQIPSVKTNYPIHIVVFPFTGKGNNTQEWIKKFADVPGGVLEGMFSSKNLVPSLLDTVLINSKLYSIVGIDTLAPNGENVLQTIYLRA